MARLGISRVTDVTRMDRLGLPVHVSVRPRSRTLRVHAGKGVAPGEARAGALMEAIEFATSEPAGSAWQAHAATVAELDGQLDGALRFVDFRPANRLRIAGHWPVAAVACEELLSRRRIFVPAELVFVPYEPEGARKLFGATTTGLASGNTLVEATLHGLLEVLERDALSMNRPCDASQAVANDELPEPFRSFAAQWQALGIELIVRHVPNAWQLPCFEAFLHEPSSSNVNLAGGSGLHPDRDIALARAICEAAQSRLSHIHGGRDDITRFYAKDAPRQRQRAAVEQAALVQRLADRRRTVPYAALRGESVQGRSLSDLLAALLARVEAAGFGTVCRYRFDAELDGLHVVKIIVPRCEDVENTPWRIGARLWAQVLRHA